MTSIVLAHSLSNIGWLQPNNCPALNPKLSLSITWQRATLPEPKHTRNQSHVLMGSVVGFQHPEMLAGATFFISRDCGCLRGARGIRLPEPLMSACPGSLSCSWSCSACTKSRGIKVENSSFSIAAFIKPSSEQMGEWQQCGIM